MIPHTLLDADCHYDHTRSDAAISSAPAISEHHVRAVVVALGSNYRAHDYLSQVRQKLRALGCIFLSTAFDNPDFTASIDQPKPDYTNQCVYLQLDEPMTFQRLQDMFKGFEDDCHRQRQAANREAVQVTANKVTMDIDILLVQLEDKRWHIMNNRYPFKAHECAGLQELIRR